MDSELFEREVERLVFERRDWATEDWYGAWNMSYGRVSDQTQTVYPVPPLAIHWIEILEGDMLPNSQKPGVAMMD